MKRRFSTILITIIFSCIVLSDNTAANVYAYTNSEFESAEVPTDDNNSILSDITPKIKYLKSNKKKQIKIKYDKIPNVEYYHIVISTDKLGRNCKEYKTTKTSYTIKKLKSKRTYYVKIRGCIGTVYNDETNEEFAKDATCFSVIKKIKVKWEKIRDSI